jgi:hypothetical protein
LGLDEATIARLQASGQLSRLALTESEIHERLYRAHLAYLHARVGRPADGADNSVALRFARSSSRLGL